MRRISCCFFLLALLLVAQSRQIATAEKAEYTHFREVGVSARVDDPTEALITEINKILKDHPYLRPSETKDTCGKTYRILQMQPYRRIGISSKSANADCDRTDNAFPQELNSTAVKKRNKDLCFIFLKCKTSNCVHTTYPSGAFSYSDQLSLAISSDEQAENNLIEKLERLLRMLNE